VKKKYRHTRPKPGLYHNRRPFGVEVIVTADELVAVGRLGGVTPPRPQASLSEVRRSLAGPFPLARDEASMESAARSAFEKLGPTRLLLESFTFRNDENRFVPVSRLNQLRRDLVAGIEEALRQELAERIARVRDAILPRSQAKPRGSAFPSSTGERGFRWSIKVDRLGFLDAFEDTDLADVEEVVVDIARDHPTLLMEKLAYWAGRLGRERLRLALPALTRQFEEKGLRQKIHHLRAAGWTKWEAANLSAWSYLGLDPARGTERATSGEELGVDLSADWSVYVLNRLAAEALTRMGVTRFTLSPEDGLGNLRSLLAEFGTRAVVVVYQDTPQFLAESCAYANLIGGCPGKANCRFESMEMVSSHGEKVTALDYHCRTIVLNQGPFCLSTRLPDLARAGVVALRADFLYRAYEPYEVRRRWRLVRAGRAVPRGHAANFDRGIL
jgi:putative protease